MKTFLCINLNDFHTNQKDASTTTKIEFISARTQKEAEDTIHKLRPNTAWFVIDKAYADSHIVCADIANPKTESPMIKKFREYDKDATRTLYIKTDEFNGLLASVGCNVRVIPRDVQLHNDYCAYEQNCLNAGDPPLSKVDYINKYSTYTCSFEISENAPAELTISKALGVSSVKVTYAKDWYGRWTDDELEVRYSVA